MSDYRERLRRYYVKYAPDKIGSLDATLVKYAGKEEPMFASLVKKYGPEPDANDPAVLAAAAPGAASPPPPAVPPGGDGVSSYAERLRRYYIKYAPDKIGSLDETLKKYAGKEEPMFASLVKKYGPEPAANDPAILAAGAGGGASIVPAAPAPSIAPAAVSPKSDFRERLRRCYIKYAPDKIGSLDETLKKYEGKEELMFASLVKKYGPEPTSDDPAVLAASALIPQQPFTHGSPAVGAAASPPGSPGFSSPPPATYAPPQAAAQPQGGPSDFRERLRRYYLKYAPDKIDSVDATLAKYVGREDTMFASFVAKYGPEPALDDPALTGGAASLPPGQQQQQQQQIPPQQLAVGEFQQSPPPQVNAAYRDRLRRFYEAYAPDKIGNLEATLTKYVGREEQMFQSLTQQFGPEPQQQQQPAGLAPPDQSLRLQGQLPPSSPLTGAESGAAGVRAPSRHRNAAAFVAGVHELAKKYAPHAPSLGEHVLEAFQGREDEVFNALCAHYDDVKSALALVDPADPAAATLRASQGHSTVWIEAVSCKLAAPGAGLSDVTLSVEVDDREVCAIRGGKEDVYTSTIMWKDGTQQQQQQQASIGVFQTAHFVGDAAFVLKWRQAALGEVSMPMCLFTIPGKATLNLKSVGRVGGSCALTVRWVSVARDVMNEVLRRLRLGVSAATTSSVQRRHGKGASIGDISLALRAGADDPWLHRIAAMYARYLPSDLAVVPDLREEYRGREQDLLDILSIRYGPEPFPSAFRSRVERIFLAHEPQRVRESLVFEAQAAGREEMTLRALVRKYGPEAQVLYSLPVFPTRAPHALTDAHRVRLTRWMVARFPKRVAQVEYFLARFYEREELLFRLMREVLGPEPVQGQREETLRSTTLSSPALRNFFSARKAPAFLQWMWRDTSATEATGAGDTNHIPTRASPLSQQSHHHQQLPTTVGLGFTPHHLRIRKRLERFYEAYNKAKLPEVDSTLRQWEGRYELMFAALVQKYGPEPGNVGGSGSPTSPSRAAAPSSPSYRGGSTEGGVGTKSGDGGERASLGFLLGDRATPQLQRPVQDYTAWAPSATVLSPGRAR